MLGSALTVRPSARRLDDEQRRLAVELGCDDEQFGIGSRRDQRLDAVESVAARGADRGGLQRGRVEQRLRLGDGQAGLRDVLAGELLEVGRLLTGAAPVGECGGDAGRRQDRQRQPHVAVGQRLGDQHVGHAGALRGDAVEVLGNVDRGDPQLGGLLDQVRGIGGRRVGVVRGRTQDLCGELLDGLDDQFLVVVGRQVVVVLAAGLQSGGSAAQVLDALELAAGRSGGGEDRLGAVAQRPVQRIAQPVLVQEFLADEGREQAQRDVDASALVLLLADGGLMVNSARPSDGMYEESRIG